MIAVRYYSRSGNTKLLAGAIAKAADTKAVSVESSNSAITEDVDVLFVGGALYAYGLDKHLKNWLSTLDGSKVQKAVIFSTSWVSKHAIELMKKELEAKGISVEETSIYAKGKPSSKDLAEAQRTVKSILDAE